MKPLEVWTCQRAVNLKKKSSKIPLRSNKGVGGAPTNYRRRRRRADQQKSAAAAPTNCRRRRRGAAGARLYTCYFFANCRKTRSLNGAVAGLAHNVQLVCKTGMEKAHLSTPSCELLFWITVKIPKCSHRHSTIT